MLQFSGGEIALAECRVQLDPTTLKFSEVNMYVTQSRLVFELEKPVHIEIDEILEMGLERSYGEQFIRLKYKDLGGIHELIFVCTGLGGIISNISRTVFIYKLVNRLRSGMDPRDIRFIVSGSTLELYKPWILLSIMLFSLAAGLIFSGGCLMRLALGIFFVGAFTAFSFTEVFNLLLGKLRWPVFLTVLAIIVLSFAVLQNSCATVEVMHSAVVFGKEKRGAQHCLDIESDIGRDIVCISNDDWNQYRIGDKISVYYMEGPLYSTIIPAKYDEH